MDKEFIEERIRELQSDNKLCFKQTSEIIEFAYRTAINDCDKSSVNKPIVKDNLSNRERDQQLIIEKQLIVINDLKKALDEEKNNSAKQKFKNKKSVSYSQKDIIDAKLEAYNKIYDMIYFKKLDLLAIYQNIKGEINDLNDKRKYIK